MDGNFAKLLITIATLKQENERLNNIINEERGAVNERNYNGGFDKSKGVDNQTQEDETSHLS